MSLILSPNSNQTHLYRRTNLLFRKVKKAKAPFLKDVEYRAIQSLFEIQQAGRLVYKQYLKKGYVDSAKEREIKLIFQQATMLSTSFIAILNNRVLATVTLVQDSKMGLPMEDQCKKELNRLRHQRRKIAEVTLFAVDDALLKTAPVPVTESDRLYIVMHLFKTMMDFNRAEGIADVWVASFLSKHDTFYDALTFKTLVPARHYTVGPTTLTACTRYLDINVSFQNAPLLARRFFDLDNPPPKGPDQKKFSPEEYLILLESIQPI